VPAAAEHLERDAATGLLLLGLEHRAHAALAKLTQDPVAVDDVRAEIRAEQSTLRVSNSRSCLTRSLMLSLDDAMNYCHP
jgi:hypothetical protein